MPRHAHNSRTIELVYLTYMVMVINAWNRASIAFRSVPGSQDKAFALDKAGLS